MHEVARLKQQAARAAVQLVQSGMIVGLGHGSTTRFAVHSLADRLARGEIEDIIAVAATEATASEARRLDIPLTSTDLDLVTDITIDGADEVDGKLNVIKDGGGALLHEKILAQASRHSWPLLLSRAPRRSCAAMATVRCFVQLKATVT